MSTTQEIIAFPWVIGVDTSRFLLSSDADVSVGGFWDQRLNGCLRQKMCREVKLLNEPHERLRNGKWRFHIHGPRPAMIRAINRWLVSGEAELIGVDIAVDFITTADEVDARRDWIMERLWFRRAHRGIQNFKGTEYFAEELDDWGLAVYSDKRSKFSGRPIWRKGKHIWRRGKRIWRKAGIIIVGDWCVHVEERIRSIAALRSVGIVESQPGVLTDKITDRFFLASIFWNDVALAEFDRQRIEAQLAKKFKNDSKYSDSAHFIASMLRRARGMDESMEVTANVLGRLCTQQGIRADRHLNRVSAPDGYMSSNLNRIRIIESEVEA